MDRTCLGLLHFSLLERNVQENCYVRELKLLEYNFRFKWATKPHVCQTQTWHAFNWLEYTNFVCFETKTDAGK